MQRLKSYRLLVAVIFAGLSIGGWARYASADVTRDSADIRMVINRYAHALNDSDIGTVMQLYADDGVFMPSNKPTSVGPDEIKNAYRIVFDTLDFDIVFHVKEIVPSGSLAFVRTSSGGHIKLIDQDRTIVNRSRELFILQKLKGAWKIARYLFNESVPSPE